MRQRLLFPFVILFFFSVEGFSQLSEVIRTGRPGQSFGQFTVGKRILQLQGGATWFDRSNPTVESRGLQELLIIRYGIAERVELSSVMSYTSEKVDEATKYSGLNQLDAGFRIHLFERPSGFSGSWQSRVKLNTLSEYYKSEDTGFTTAFSLGYPILNGAFTFNGGFIWDGNNQGAIFNYSLRYARAVADKFVAFLEPYGSYNDEINLFINTGVGWLITKDLMVDTSVGIDLDDTRELFFFDVGFSYRILAFR